jgi:hypothetical protein
MMDETKIRNTICALPHSQSKFIAMRIMRKQYINAVVSVVRAIKYRKNG